MYKNNNLYNDKNLVLNPNNSKRLLYEVSIIRPFVIFLLIIMHSFTMFAGGWIMPEGIHEVTAYFWFVKFILDLELKQLHWSQDTFMHTNHWFCIASIRLGRLLIRNSYVL